MVMSITPAPAAVSLERQVRARVASLSYLPTTVAVAMRFVELSRDPNAEPADYLKVISADSSLASKILSLVNGSWFGVRNRVTKLPMAINLLGLGTVRTLAMSYCLTGLHHELRLTPDEARMFWASALCKAVAARRLAQRLDESVADEAFTAGLFQDFALPILYVAARKPILEVLQAPDSDSQLQLQREREILRLDHAQVGRLVAQKLELPELFVDTVAMHHSSEGFGQLVGEGALAQAIHAASLFPHLLNTWNRADATALSRFLAQLKPVAIEPNQFLQEVEEEFDQTYRYFERGAAPEVRLTELLEEATREVADSATNLVGALQDLLQQAADAGQQVQVLLQQHTRLEEAATRDPLTAVLNRDGFFARATELLTKAGRYGASCTLIYFDVDHFKAINDTYGHARGDVALGEITRCIQGNVRQTDPIGRLGGDEFALLLSGCAQADALAIVERILTAVRALRLGGSAGTGAPAESSPDITVSAGFLWVSPKVTQRDLAKLLVQADKLMYSAKGQGGNTLCTGSVPEA